MDIELQPLSKHEGVERPENGSSSSQMMEVQNNSQLPESSRQPKHEVTQRSESDDSKRSQKPQAKYGCRPPKCPMSNTELSEWILEAEREDRRWSADVRIEDDETNQPKPAGVRWPPNVRPSAIRHRGCSYRLPASEPIPIAPIRFDPSNHLWVRQEQRRLRSRIQKKVPKKKDKSSLTALVDVGFDVKMLSNSDQWEDFDSDEELYTKDGKLQCPICDRAPDLDHEDVEIAVDVTPPGDATAATIIATDTTTIITCSATAPSAQAGTIAMQDAQAASIFVHDAQAASIAVHDVQIGEAVVEALAIN